MTRGVGVARRLAMVAILVAALSTPSLAAAAASSTGSALSLLYAPQQTRGAYVYDAPRASTTRLTNARTGTRIARSAPTGAAWSLTPSIAAFRAAKSVTGGAGPVLKGQAGVRSSIDEAIARGERLRGTEVTVEAPSGARVRLDYLTEVDGRLVATEVKTGPYARLSARQRAIFGELEQHGGTFVGGNAERFGLSGRFPARPIRRDFRP